MEKTQALFWFNCRHWEETEGTVEEDIFSKEKDIFFAVFCGQRSHQQSQSFGLWVKNTARGIHSV